MVIGVRRAVVLAMLGWVGVAAAAEPIPAQRLGEWGVDVSGMDRGVSPGEDFVAFASGTWAKTAVIPGDRTRWGAFDQLRELSDKRVRQIIEKGAWSEDSSEVATADRAKISALFASYMNEAEVEKRGVSVLGSRLDAIRAAATREELARIMGTSSGGFGASFFGVGVGDDAKNPDYYVASLRQSGLGLPDRDYYLAERFKAQRDRYRQYVGLMLQAAGWEEPEVNAERILALETAIAGVHWTRADSRDRDKTYNPTTLAELEASSPGFPWRAYFDAAGLGDPGKIVVSQKSAVAGLAEVFAKADEQTLRAWLAFRLIDEAATLLNKSVADLHWEFRTKFLSGVPEQRERARRAVSFVEGAMGEAVGREYVAIYFPTESKAQMDALVADVKLAMKGRIERLEWMSPETKAQALEKLSKFTTKIGYPSKWRDYSALQPVADDLFGNAARARQFSWDISRKRVGQKVDKSEWGMTPQTVNAYYSSTRNEIVFPAAILQPPFFDPKADPAVNYGAIGGVIGHEICHGFDDQGRKSDGDGVLRDWWTKEDAIKFEAETRKLGAQYEAFTFPAHPGMKITARLTMGENIADLAGITVALDAYRLSLGGKPAPVIDGFTGDQRVFLGWAQVWRSLTRDEALKQQLMTDSHSPGHIRAFAPLRNVDAWYEAFGVKEGDKLWIPPAERVRVW